MFSTMHEGRTQLTQRGLAAGDSSRSSTRAPHIMTVYIGGAPEQITKGFCFAGDIADVFKIDTSVIADFDKHAVIEKVVQGPPDIEGKWNLCTVMMAFAPGMYSKPANVQRALAQTIIADYTSRKEVQMPRDNVCLPNFLYRVY